MRPDMVCVEVLGEEAAGSVESTVWRGLDHVEKLTLLAQF